MRHLGRGLAAIILLALAYAAPSDIFGQKKPAAKNSPTIATEADYANIRRNKDLSGTLVSIDTTTLTVRVSTSHFEPNPNYKPPKNTTNNRNNRSNNAANSQARQIQQYEHQQWQHYQNLLRDQQQAMQATNPQQRQQALNRIAQEMARFQMQQAQSLARLEQSTLNSAYRNMAKNYNANNKNGPFKVVTTSKDYELPIKDGVVVRKMFLATEFDDTGNYKVYTAKEKADLRGTDTTKPGYLAKLEDASPGQEVTLHLTPPKTAKKDAKADEDGGGMAERSTVTMIVLTKDSSAASTQTAPPKGKK